MLVIKCYLYCFVLLSVLGIFACNDAASIDTDLVDIDLLNIKSEDSFDISSLTTTEDSLIAYQAGFVLLTKYPFGKYQDPVFGSVDASIVSQIYTTTIDAPDFTDAVLDSTIMYINLNEAEPTYGDTTQLLGIEVYEISETLDGGNTYYSNKVTPTESSPIGSYTGVPNFRDSVQVNRYFGDTLSTDVLPPHIRIPLSSDFSEKVIASGDDVLSSPSEFLAMFKGIELRPTLESGGMVAFDLRKYNSRNTPNLNGASIILFYTQGGVAKQYRLAINPSSSVKYEQQQHDFTGSMIEPFLNDESKGDEMIFVQGLTGPNAIIILNDVDILNGAIINGATLEVYATALNGEQDIRPVPDQLVLRERIDNGTLAYIRDFNSASQAGSLSRVGGVPEDLGGGIFKYSFNIGSQLQDIIEGERPKELYIRNNAKVANMRRAVLFGAGHSTYPIKLIVTYTKL